MITHVLLRNWRGYQKLNLDLGPGLTFVVADNGVGKTSLVQGAAWALFGDASGVDGAAAIRAGAPETTVEVDLVLGDTRFVVSRTRQRIGRQPERLAVRIDGAVPPVVDEGADPHTRPPVATDSVAAAIMQRLATATEEAPGAITVTRSPGTGEGAVAALLAQALATWTHVPEDILPQLMFVPEMRLTHEGELFADVQDHLAALLGIADLRRAARTAGVAARSAARQIRTTKYDARVDAAALAATRDELASLHTELERLDTAIDGDRAARQGLDQQRIQIDAWTRYEHQLARYQDRLAELTEQAEAVGLEADPDAVATAAEELTARSHDLRDTLAQARAEGELVEGLVAQLGSADPVCPVCLQAVDDEVAHQAAATHQARLEEIAAREAAARERQAEIETAARQIMTIAGTLARLEPPEPPAVPQPEMDDVELEARLSALDAALDDKRVRKAALGERMRQLEQALAEADEGHARAAELARLHAVVAAASSLAELAQAEADARTERSLDPLSRTLADRWREFFERTSSRPRLAGRGTIELGGAAAGATSIPYASFSGGEKTLASLLTRLLFVTSATRLRTMWLDEPLEHLDPANRTRLARLVAQATRPGNHMQQLVVTTYEEHLARTMADRADAKVVYVSTDALL